MIIPAFGRIASERFIHVPTRPEIDRKIHEAINEIWSNSNGYGKNAGNWGGDPHASWVNPPARARLFGAIADARNRINQEYINQITAQVNFGRNITKISPSTIYQCASEAIFVTGVSRFRILYNQLKTYRETLRNFIIYTDKKDTESWHLLAESHGILLSQKPISYDAIPKFFESDTAMYTDLKNVVFNTVVLVLLNIFLFMAINISFLKLDIRQP